MNGTRLFSTAARLLLSAVVLAQDTAPETAPATIRELGDGRYQIGAIIVDKPGQKLTVPGRVLRLEPPLEYLASTPNGGKAYEALLELDTDAYQFNLACILIGLDNNDVTLPEYQFDAKPIAGPPVAITASWDSDGKTVTVGINELLHIDGKVPAAGGWVYTGSHEMDGDPPVYMAHFLGTLIGFVHDPASVIGHKTGLGIGAYGSVGGNSELLGEVGLELRLSVERVSPGQHATKPE